ncbi:MAG TPA: MBL fold metallo-hydrolase, partial [Candidatus Limnocylindrales bacterium]|nr:MBL fold metallo-hydrolase [Candidatus Limnocylindrales bacterium]
MQAEPNVIRFADTVNVYVLRRDDEAILIDFGGGDVLGHLGAFGVERVTDVLLTHFHRDVTQGLARAHAAGIRIWAPPTERDLIERVDEHWQARPLDNIYDLREDRFALLEPVPLTGVVEEYRTRRFGAFDVLTLPTPGHTLGSVSYVVDMDGRRLAFTGDLIAAPGKVWSLAATQWTYTGIEGLGSTMLSGLGLLDQAADRLLPAHGEPIDDPPAAITLLNDRLQRLIDMRTPEWRPADLRATPWLEISKHLLRNRTSVANTYALLSDDGSALLIDYGYDFTTGLPSGTDRSSRRPWLETIPALKRQFGIDR